MEHKKGNARLGMILLVVAMLAFVLWLGLGRTASVIDLSQGWNGDLTLLSENQEFATYLVSYSTSSPKGVAFADSNGNLGITFALADRDGADHPLDVQLNTEFVASDVTLIGLTATEGSLSQESIVAVCEAKPRESGRIAGGGPYENAPGLVCRLTGAVTSDDPDAKFYGLQAVNIRLDIYKNGFSQPTQIDSTSDVGGSEIETITIDTQTQEPIQSDSQSNGTATIDTEPSLFKRILNWIREFFSK